MTEINELEGKELAAAVAIARGWHKHRDSRQYSAWFWIDEAGTDQTAVEYYRPDRHIWKAWELDSEGWLWDFRERQAYLMANVRHNDPWFDRYVGVDWADFPTKAQAYATARCRAFLKAKAAA